MTYTNQPWCKTHLKTIGRDQFDNYYSQCYVGHIRNEKCEIVGHKHDPVTHQNGQIICRTCGLDEANVSGKEVSA